VMRHPSPAARAIRSLRDTVNWPETLRR
jgi:hypothetical protein